MKEPSTRLAALLAGEVQLADLPQDLRGQATARGYKALAGKASSFRVFLRHFCCYLNDPADPSKGAMHPNSPLMDVRVRKALSKAIDRNELNKAFFGGEGVIAASVQINATRPGWDPSWERRFQDEYGYDPDAARKLLAEAGYEIGRAHV